MSDSIDTLTSVTNKIKTAVEEKSNRLLNKTNTIIEKVKSQTKIIETAIDHSEVLSQNTKKQLNEALRPDVAANSTNKTNVDTKNGDNTNKKLTQTKTQKYRNVNPKSQTKNKSDNKTSHKHSANSSSQDDNEIIDLTNDSKKKINQSTLLVGSSIVKGIKTRDLQSTVAVRTFPGARTDTIYKSLSQYDITSLGRELIQYTRASRNMT